MKFKAVIGAVSAALAIGSLPLLAHHSFTAEYDNTKQLKLTGRFVKMDWVNPHSWVHFEVTNADGTKTMWKGETPPPNSLYRNGWRKDMIPQDEPVEVSGFAAKDGTTHMWASNVRLLKLGTTLSLNSVPPGQGPPDAKGK